MNKGIRIILRILLNLLLILSPVIAFSQELLVLRGDGDYSPFEKEENQVFSGFHVELVRTVANDLNISIQFKSFPWKRAIYMMQKGQADAITYIGKNSEREQFTIFTEGNELSWVHSGLVILESRKNEILYNGGNLNSLKHYQFIQLLGYIYGKAYDNAQLDKREVGDMEQLLVNLHLKRSDIGVVDRDKFRARKLRGDKNIEGLVILDAPIKIANYIGFSKLRGYELLSKKFAGAMEKYKMTQEFIELQKKYGITY